MADLNNTYAAYPIVYRDGINLQLARAILDIKLVLVFGASSTKSPGYTFDQLTVQLSSLNYTTHTATFLCLSPMYLSGRTTISAPLIIGRDTTVSPGSSYIRMEEEVVLSQADSTALATGLYEVHPDCFIVEQTAPLISVQERLDANVYSDETEAVPGTVVYYDDTPIQLVNGHNVRIELIDSVVTITAGSGEGLGVYTAPPYKDVVTYATRANIGLRAIQNNFGPVSIDGGASITVSVQNGAYMNPPLVVEVDGTQLQTVVITIKPIIRM